MSDQNMWDAVCQAYARLSVHEFALEVMMANWLAGMSEQEADAFLEDFQNKSRQPWVAGESSLDDANSRKVVEDSVALTDHFADKVRKRAKEMRDKQG